MNDETDFDVWVHGAIGVEYLLQLDGVPASGQVRHIQREIRRVGGEAVHCALALANWGASVCLTGTPQGNDGNGRFVAKELAAVTNLTLRAPFHDEYETPYCVVLGSPHKPHSLLVRNEISNHDRAESDRQADASTRELAGAPATHLATCDSSGATRTYPLLLNMRERGIPLFARDVQEPIAFLAEVVLLSSTAYPSADEQEMMSVAYELAHRWKNTVVIERGAQGCIWCRAGDQAQRYEAPNVGEPDPLGGIGAADVFRAGLLWSRLQAWTWEQSLRFASAASALKYPLPDGIPSLGQIEAIL